MKGDVPVDLGDLVVVVGAHGLLGLVVNAGGKAIAAKQRRWGSVVKEGRVNGAPRLQIRPQPRAETPRLRSASAVLLLRQWAGDLGEGGEEKDREPARPFMDRRRSRLLLPLIECQIDGIVWIGSRPRGSRGARA